MNLTRPFDRQDVLDLNQTKQPFRDSTCHYCMCRRVQSVAVIDGREYVTISREYYNGMKPGTQMTMEDAVRHLNEDTRLEFLTSYYVAGSGPLEGWK